MSQVPVTKTNFTQEQAERAVLDALRAAKMDGRWMAAVWSVHDGGIRVATCTTWKFPGEPEYTALALRQLKELREAEVKGPRPENQQPLPLADHLNLHTGETEEPDEPAQLD